MADIYSPSKRSAVMSRIRARDSRAEIALRRALHRLGLRYRLHVAMLPGRPDIVFPRFKTVVFVHGCFWHSHPHCKRSTTPQSNQSFWIPKLHANAERDIAVREALTVMGWRVFVAWECEIKKDVSTLAASIAAMVRTGMKK